jgi:hypothetical protein
MRRHVLAVIGGGFYYETPVIVQLNDDPVIWFRRDEQGYLLLSIRMMSISREPRVRMEDNWWLSAGDPEDLESPPSGRILRVLYGNGDYLRVEFLDAPSFEELKSRYPRVPQDVTSLEFPLTVVEVHCRAGGTEIEFGPTEARFTGGKVVKGAWVRNCGVGVCIRTRRPGID